MDNFSFSRNERVVLEQYHVMVEVLCICGQTQLTKQYARPTTSSISASLQSNIITGIQYIKPPAISVCSTLPKNYVYSFSHCLYKTAADREKITVSAEL